MIKLSYVHRTPCLSPLCYSWCSQPHCACCSVHTCRAEDVVPSGGCRNRDVHVQLMKRSAERSATELQAGAGSDSLGMSFASLTAYIVLESTFTHYFNCQDPRRSFRCTYWNIIPLGSRCNIKTWNLSVKPSHIIKWNNDNQIKKQIWKQKSDATD